MWDDGAPSPVTPGPGHRCGLASRRRHRNRVFVRPGAEPPDENDAPGHAESAEQGERAAPRDDRLGVRGPGDEQSPDERCEPAHEPGRHPDGPLGPGAGVGREDFLKNYQNSELDPKWLLRVSKLGGRGWKDFVARKKDRIKELLSEIHGLATETGLEIQEFRKIVLLVQNG